MQSRVTEDSPAHPARPNVAATHNPTGLRCMHDPWQRLQYLWSSSIRGGSVERRERFLVLEVRRVSLAGAAGSWKENHKRNKSHGTGRHHPSCLPSKNHIDVYNESSRSTEVKEEYNTDYCILGIFAIRSDYYAETNKKQNITLDKFPPDVQSFYTGRPGPRHLRREGLLSCGQRLHLAEELEKRLKEMRRGRTTLRRSDELMQAGYRCA